VFKLEFKKSPSYKDDSNESCNLNLKKHPSVAIIATHYFFYIKVTFNEKTGLFLFLDNLEQTVASYRERNKIKSYKDIIKNFKSILKMYKNHDAIQSEFDEYGSVKDTSANAHIKDVNYTFFPLPSSHG